MLLIREFFDLPSKPVFTPPLFPTFAGTICQDEDCTHADFCEIKTNISLGNRLRFNRIHLISIYREFNFICQRLDSNLSKSWSWISHKYFTPEMWQIQPWDPPFLGGQGGVKVLPARMTFGRGKVSQGEFFAFGTHKPPCAMHTPPWYL